jgi:WD40 repeat protein
VWAAQDGRLLAELRGHEAEVRIANFSPDGQRIVTVCAFHKARIWNISPEVRTPEQLDRIIRCRSCVRFDREDGSVLVRCVPSPAQEEDGVAL